MRAAMDSGKKWMFQQACEGGGLELEAARRHAYGGPYFQQWDLGGCGSAGHWDGGMP